MPIQSAARNCITLFWDTWSFWNCGRAASVDSEEKTSSSSIRDQRLLSLWKVQRPLMAQGSSSSESSLWTGVRRGYEGRGRRKEQEEEEKREKGQLDIMHCYVFHFFSNIPHLGPGNFLELWNLLYNCCTCTLPSAHSCLVPV